MKLGPLEKLSCLDCLFEGGTIDEAILVTALTRSRLTGRPTLTEPQVIVGAHEAPRQCSFANATRSNKNDQ
jgi:hypothetical protein